MIDTVCHCGAVRVTLPRPPQRLTQCNCSLCRKLGTLWAYFTPAEVTVTGETETYVQGDRTLATHRCRVCGCVSHWSSLTGADRLGVNVRLMDPAALADIPVRRFDGADTWTYLD
mgnify:CR=1 FL=1